MDRRALLTFVAATALAGSLGPGAAYAQDTVKIGVIGPKTGFMAAAPPSPIGRTSSSGPRRSTIAAA